MAAPMQPAHAVRMYIPKFGCEVLIDPSHPLAVAAHAAVAATGASRHAERPVSADTHTLVAAPEPAAQPTRRRRSKSIADDTTGGVES